MSAPESKRTVKSAARNRGEANESAAEFRDQEMESLPEAGTIGEIRIEAGPAFSPSARLKVRGINVLVAQAKSEKEKVSLTLGKSLVEEIRGRFGDRSLSASINQLLHSAMESERLSELVDEMEQEAGSPSPAAYEQILAQWFAQE